MGGGMGGGMGGDRDGREGPDVSNQSVPLSVRMRWMVQKELQINGYYKNVSQALRQARHQRTVVFCLAGDSNSRRYVVGVG